MSSVSNVNISLDIGEQRTFEYNRIYIYRVLKENILNLKLKPGEKISEVKIKNLFNVSRSPIREAIVRLVDESLIDVLPQRGTYVSLLDQNFIEESLFMRTALDKEIMRIACSKSCDTDKLIEILENIFQKQVSIASNDMDEDSIMKFLELNEEFHKSIYEYLNKLRIWKNIGIFATHYVRFHMLESIAKTNVDFAIGQHTGIIKAIKNKDYSMAKKTEENILTNYKIKVRKVYDEYPDYFKYKL